MLKNRSLTLLAISFSFIGFLLGSTQVHAQNKIQEGEMAGYLLVPHEKVPESYNAGFSMAENCVTNGVEEVAAAPSLHQRTLGTIP